MSAKLINWIFTVLGTKNGSLTCFSSRTAFIHVTFRLSMEGQEKRESKDIRTPQRRWSFFLPAYVCTIGSGDKQAPVDPRQMQSISSCVFVSSPILSLSRTCTDQTVTCGHSHRRGSSVQEDEASVHVRNLVDIIFLGGCRWRNYKKVYAETKSTWRLSEAYWKTLIFRHVEGCVHHFT